MKKIVFFSIVYFVVLLTTAGQSADIQDIDSINALGKTYTYTDPGVALKYSEQALELAEKSGYNKGIAEASNNLGIIYFNWGIYEYALGYFYEAMNEYKLASDRDGFSKALNNLGVCANVMKEYELALHLFFQSLKIQQFFNNLENISELYNNIATIYTNIEKFEEAEYYLKLSLSISDSIGYNRGKANCLNNIGVFFEKTGNLDSALYYYELGYSTAMQSEEQDYQKYIFLQNQARILELQGRYSESIDILDSGIDKLKKYGAIAVELTYYELYARLYANLGDFENAYDNQVLYLKMKDEIMSADVSQKFTQMIISFQQQQYQKELYLMDEKIRFRKSFQWTLTAVIAILIGVVILLVFYLKTKSALAKKTKELSLLEKEALELQMQKQYEVSEQQKQELREEISSKERELVSTTLNLINKSETIDDLRKFLNNLVSSGQLNKSSQTYKQIDELIVNASRVDNMWQDFFMHFEKVYPDFFSSLRKKYPMLNNSDLKFCAYLKLNLNNKDLARIYNVTEQSLKIKKNRLRKKMQMDNHTQLQQAISDI